MNHLHHFIESKFVQSITAFIVSFSATMVDLGKDKFGDYQFWIETGQLITIYGGIVIGLIRFVYWWKDRKRKLAVKPKSNGNTL